MSTESSSKDDDYILDIINDNYLILYKIMSGAFASIFLAYDFKTNLYRAIKINFNTSEDLKAANHEVKMYDRISKINNDNLMSCIEYFHHNERLCIVMELMAGSLDNIIDIFNYFKIPIPIKIVIHLFKQMSSGIKSLHDNGLTHNDIKIENMLFTLGTSSEPETSDFRRFTADVNGELIINKNVRKIIDKTQKYLNKKKVKKINKEYLSSLLADIDDSESNSDFDETDSECSDDTASGSVKSCETAITDNTELFNLDELFHSFNTVKPDASLLLRQEGTLSSQEENENTEYSDKYDKDMLKIIVDNYENIVVKITDFGMMLYPEQKHIHRHGQTKYYKSPEILLGNPFGIESDIWALGCNLYEFLTGEILFNVSNQKYNTERYHLFLIENTIARIPKEIIEKSPKHIILFEKNTNKIKNTSVYTYFKIDIKNNILKEYGYTDAVSSRNTSVSELESINTFITIIYECLQIDKGKRISINEIINLIN